MSEGQFQPELLGVDTNPMKGNFLGAHAMSSDNLITSKASPFQGEQSQNPDVPLVSDEYIREDDSYGGLKDLLISGQDDEDPSNKSPNLE